MHLYLILENDEREHSVRTSQHPLQVCIYIINVILHSLLWICTISKIFAIELKNLSMLFSTLEENEKDFQNMHCHVEKNFFL